jgi:hypothetical protein
LKNEDENLVGGGGGLLDLPDMKIKERRLKMMRDDDLASRCGVWEAGT